MNDVPAPIVTQWIDERGNTVIHTVTFRKARDSDYTNPGIVYDPTRRVFDDFETDQQYVD